MTKPLEALAPEDQSALTAIFTPIFNAVLSGAITTEQAARGVAVAAVDASRIASFKAVMASMAADGRFRAGLSSEVLLYQEGRLTGFAVDADGYVRGKMKMGGQAALVDSDGTDLLVPLPGNGVVLAQGQRVLSDRYAYIMGMDRAGIPTIAFTPEGFLETRPGHPMLSDEWVYLELFPDGAIRYGVRADGSVLIGPVSAIDWRVEMRGASEATRHVYLSAPGQAELQVTETTGDYRGAAIRGLQLSYLTVVGGVATETQMSMLPSTAFSEAIREVEGIHGSGQSLSNGQGATPILTTAAVSTGRIVMATAGVKATGTSQSGSFVNEAIETSDIASLVDAFEQNAESPMSQMAAVFLSSQAATIGAVISTHGVGGQAYAALKKGTVPYANMLRMVRRSNLLCALLGKLYRTRYSPWTQGENNIADTQATYTGYLTEYQGDITADFNAITGRTEQVILVVDQVSNFTAYSRTTSDIVLAQHQVAVDQPTKFLCYSAKYMLPTVDGIHLTNYSSANLGARRGRAMAQHRAGSYTGALYVTSAVRTGASIVLTFNMPFGGANLDLFTGLVSNPGNFGLEWFQTGGNSPVISYVAITAANQVTITLSLTPTGTAQKVGVGWTGTSGNNAGPTTGARCCIRSATSDVDAYATPMDHYPLHQLIPVT